MSEHLTREDVVVAATKAALGAQPHIPASMHEYSLIVDAALPVIAKAITDRVRAHHHREDPWCLGDCPADVLCDEIDTEMGVQR
ncbi:hypothetical protein [Micropruina sp.]|uniref:hypothetical protein n=1 Tax=Micropruina sp. TaxID=2737536 RepID=UPI0039E3E29D